MENRKKSDQDSPPQRSTPPLSKTERRVYDLLMKRMTERQVAEHLERSPNTIHVHVRNIYRKIGVRSRLQLYNAHNHAAKKKNKP